MKKFNLGFLVTAIAFSGIAVANDHQEDILHVMALKASSTTISQLAPMIQKSAPGIVTEIELDDTDNNVLAYEFEVVDLEAGNRHELNFAIDDQTLINQESTSLTHFFFNSLESEEQSAIEAVQNAKFDILAVIPELENKHNAHVIEVELEEKKGIVFYEVKLFSSTQGKHKLLIDIETGEEFPVHHKRK
jgi:uncharacterized membrane protein YkoI